MSFLGLGDLMQGSLDQSVEAAGALFERTLRLGVTGLAGSGKTVFITALVHNLLRPGRLPLLGAVAEGRLEAALLRPQPDSHVPRFDYESHVAAIQGREESAPPHWPQSTRALAQLRVSLRARTPGILWRQLSPTSLLNLDIVDYPGEWLLDVALLKQSFAQWSEQMLRRAHSPRRADAAAPWLEALAALDPAAPEDEAEARRLAGLYTQYLRAGQSDPALVALAQPGRFLLPGDLAGSPMLEFCPLPPRDPRAGRRSLAALMERRFEAYKDRVVRPFFREHLSRIERQVVLVDLLSALNAGPAAVAELEETLDQVLEVFRPGANSWLSALIGRRVERMLFCATKADHVPVDQHDRLADLLRQLMFDPINRAAFRGAEVETLALAAVRATRPATVRHEGREVECVEGMLPGRARPAFVFPGRVPARREDIPAAEGSHQFVRFRPPDQAGHDGRGLPHVRLDRALQFLIGDRL